jgi:hypothetical protein
MQNAPPRNPALDLSIGVIGLWLAAGFSADGWAHLHVAVESFFTPYHAIFYAAMATGAIVLIATALRNRARGYQGLNLWPASYRLPLLGIPLFFIGGVGDLIWHTIFGVEERVEAVTSPTHMVIALGIFLVMSAPILSALRVRDRLRTLASQLPLLFAAATWLEFVHLGTAYAFDPSAALIYQPPNEILYSPDLFTNITMTSYKVGAGIAIVILQTFILMGFATWLASNFALRPGAITVFFLFGNCMMAASITNDTPLLETYVAMSILGGLAADMLVAGSRSRPMSGRRLHVFGFVVPIVYFATYFIVTIATGGTWWDPALIGGALGWAGLVGAALTLLVPTQKRQPLLP